MLLVKPALLPQLLFNGQNTAGIVSGGLRRESMGVVALGLIAPGEKGILRDLAKVANGLTGFLGQGVSEGDMCACQEDDKR